MGLGITPGARIMMTMADDLQRLVVWISFVLMTTTQRHIAAELIASKVYIAHLVD
jgi:hypothetical protein